jgi:hypothetical protein
MGKADDDVDEVTQAAADKFLAAWTTFYTHADTNIGTGVKTKGVRVQKLNPEDGKVYPAYNFYAYPTVPIPGSGGVTLVPQISLVVSLQARPDAGLGAKGRMFLPGVDESIDSTGHIATSITAKYALNLATMFNALNDDTDIDGRLINASRGRNLQLFGDMPVNRYVQDVLVGNVYDTQRRRRNQLQETYVSSEVFLD